MTSSPSASLLGSQEPRVAVAPRAKTSDADDACFLASAYGLTPDPWQYTVIDGWLSRRGDGRWAASTAGCSVPRQNGKNGILEIVELYFIVGLGLKILHTAHEVKTARKAFLRLCSFFENEREYPELAALVKDIRRTNGQEALILNNGGSVEFIARSKGSGRGFTVDVLVCDEAQELSDDALEALTPTTSAAPSGDPMTIFTGTPPSPSMDGEVWTRVRSGAISGKDPRISWYEWSVIGDVDLDDRALWASTNPALGTRLNIETLEAERNRFSDAGFARERLGMWAASTGLEPVITEPAWRSQASEGVPNETPPTALSVDQWYDGTTAVGAAWRTDDGWHTEVLALDHVHDTAAVVDLLVKWAGRKITVGVAGDSPAAAMIGELRSRGVKVNALSVADLGKACVGFLGDVTQKRLTYKQEDQLDAAVFGAKKSGIGSSGLWRWDRRNPEINLTPLMVITLARYAASVTKHKDRTGQSVFR